MGEDTLGIEDERPAPSDSDDVARWCKAILTEIAMGYAYYRTYSTLLGALSGNSPLVRYHDFLEITLTAHLSGLILELSHLLDRDARTASINWLLNYAEAHPERFPVATPVSALRTRVATAGETMASLRRIRNKLVAHRERLTSPALQVLADEGRAVVAGAQNLLDCLGATVHEVLACDRTCNWRLVMIAIDEETDEVIDALLRGAA
jgi:hypothetical protein